MRRPKFTSCEVGDFVMSGEDRYVPAHYEFFTVHLVKNNGARERMSEPDVMLSDVLSDLVFERRKVDGMTRDIWVRVS